MSPRRFRARIPKRAFRITQFLTQFLATRRTIFFREQTLVAYGNKLDGCASKFGNHLMVDRPTRKTHTAINARRRRRQRVSIMNSTYGLIIEMYRTNKIASLKEQKYVMNFYFDSLKIFF